MHQPSFTSVNRDAWVEVDLDALEENVREIRSWLSPGTEFMAVVKSDAYGHGAVGIAPILMVSGATWLGVASVDEGVQLRETGIKGPILVLSPCPFWAISAALEASLTFTVTSASQARDLAKMARRYGKRAMVHLKVDTGMHRLGVSPSLVRDVTGQILADPALELAGIFSHLARSDDMGTTQAQNLCFQEVLATILDVGATQALIHLASGEAARRAPDTHYDLVRVGLYLYGLEPKTISRVVRPIMSVRARINHLQVIDAGESVGYDLTWTANRISRIASIPIGYADGVDRQLSNRITGLLMGVRIQQVGLISMDQMLFDVTDAPEAQEGDVITLIGQEHGSASKVVPSVAADRCLYLATWAKLLNSITYELACCLRVRLPRIYTRARPT